MTKLTTILGQIEAAQKQYGRVDSKLLVDAIKELARMVEKNSVDMVFARTLILEHAERLKALEQRLPVEEDTRG